MRTMMIVPTNPDVRVRNPETMLHVPETGERVPAEGPAATYWRRQIAAGDLREVTDGAEIVSADSDTDAPQT